MRIVKIFAHDEFPQEAAELFEKEGIVAVGWSRFGNLNGLTYDEIKQKSKKLWKRTESQSAKDASQLIMFRDDVEIGDIVLAYLGGNRVALVGEVIGGYKFNTKNATGNLKGKIAYANQRKVSWRDKPRNFDRHLLPDDLSQWVAIPGTISLKPYNKIKFEKAIQSIPSQETVTKALEIHDEDEIKDYMEKHIGEIEKGLVLIEREYQTSTGPMDFLAKDKDGVSTVIEVKMKADDHTITQLRRYMRSFKNDSGKAKVRGIVVAEEFSKTSLDDAKEHRDLGMDIRVCKCRKQFGFERLL